MAAVDLISQIKRHLEAADRILVITHVGPDGDAISSLTAMGVALKQIGKSFSLVCDDGLPERFRYLPLSDLVRSAPETDISYDLIIALDAGDLERLGRAYADLSQPKPPIINLDHHITNTNYGMLNLIRPETNSTTEVLHGFFNELEVPLTRDLAICLLTGLVTDTLSFRTASVNAVTLRTAAELVDAGADLFEVTTKALNLKPLSTLLLWQTGLNNMHQEDGFLWTSISKEESELAGHSGTSSFGLGNLLADVEEVVLSVVILEMADGQISVGFRCRPPYSVSELAQSLGGGGHHLAAGCTIAGPLMAAETLVVARTREFLQQQRVVNQDRPLESTTYSSPQ